MGRAPLRSDSLLAWRKPTSGCAKGCGLGRGAKGSPTLSGAVSSGFSAPPMRSTAYAIKSIIKPAAEMVEVEGTEEFEAWFLALAAKEAEAVARVVGLLEEWRSASPTAARLRDRKHCANLGFNRAGILCACFMRSTRCAGQCCSWAETRLGMTGSMKHSCRVRSSYGPNTSPTWRKRRRENEDQALA